MATSIFSILEEISSIFLPGVHVIRRRFSGREAYCDTSTLLEADHRSAGTMIMTHRDEEICSNIFSYFNKNISTDFLFSRDPVFNSTSNHAFLSFQFHMFEICDNDMPPWTYNPSERTSKIESVDTNFTRPSLRVQHVEFNSFLTVQHINTCPAGQSREGKDLIQPSYNDTGIRTSNTKLSSHYAYTPAWNICTACI